MTTQDILERETIIAKLAAQAREKSMTRGNLDFDIDKPYSSSYEAGYRDALSRLWNSNADVEDVIRTLARS